MMLVGGSGWTDDVCAQILTFAEANGIQVACSFQRQDILDNASECYVGDFDTAVVLSIIKRLAEADLLLVVGARLGEMTTRTYTTLTSTKPSPTLIHVHIEPDEIDVPLWIAQHGGAPLATVSGVLEHPEICTYEFTLPVSPVHKAVAHLSDVSEFANRALHRAPFASSVCRVCRYKYGDHKAC